MPKNAGTFILFKTTEFIAVLCLNEVLTPMSTNMETTAAISVPQISFPPSSVSPGIDLHVPAIEKDHLIHCLTDNLISQTCSSEEHNKVV